MRTVGAKTPATVGSSIEDAPNRNVGHPRRTGSGQEEKPGSKVETLNLPRTTEGQFGMQQERPLTLSLSAAKNGGYIQCSHVIERVPDPNHLADLVLCTSSFIMRRTLFASKSDWDTLIGTLFDDLCQAMKGQRTQFEFAPLVWWELRQRFLPCRVGNRVFRYGSIPTQISTFSSLDSFWPLGATEPIISIHPGPKPLDSPDTAPIDSYGIIDVANADYSRALKLINASFDELRVCRNPYKGKPNKDPSAFASYRMTTIGSSLGFNIKNQKQSDHSVYARSPIKTRWIAASSLCVIESTSTAPYGYSRLCGSRSVEIGHKFYCTSINAPAEVERALPVTVHVSLKEILGKFMAYWQSVWEFSGNPAESGITLRQFVAYIILQIAQWFAPWSACVYPRGGNQSELLMVSTCGFSQNYNLWQGSTIPAVLACQLVNLSPAYENGRIFYPALVLDTDLEDFNTTLYPCFSSNGYNCFGSYIGNMWTYTFDNDGLVRAYLVKYSSLAPMRTYPKYTARRNLSGFVRLSWNDTGQVPTVLCPRNPTPQDLLDCELFVLPFLPELDNVTFAEHYRMLDPVTELWTPGYPNGTDWTPFVSANGYSALNSSLVSYLHDLDCSQLEGDFHSWLPISLSEFVSTTAKPASMDFLAEFVENAAVDPNFVT